MTSTMLPTGATFYSLAHEAELVELLPHGSRQRMVANLWQSWLEHIARCQQLATTVADCPENYRNIEQFESNYRSSGFDWECCDKHIELKNERKQLETAAQRLDWVLGLPPHHTREVLTEIWWAQHNHIYIPHLPVQA